MKKLFALLLVAVLTLGMTVSCSYLKYTVKDDGDETKAEATDAQTEAETLAETPKVDGYDRGLTSEEGWISKYFGLKFTPDSSMIMTTSEEIDAMMEVGADAILGEENGKKLYDFTKITNVYEMMAVSLEGTSALVMAEKPLLSNISIDQYVEAVKSQFSKLTSQMAGLQIGEAVDYEFCGQTFKKMSISYSMSGVQIKQTYLLKKFDDRFLGVIITARDEASFNKIAAMFSAA